MSSSSSNTPTPSHATPEYRLQNCLQEFGTPNVTVLGDRLDASTRTMVLATGVRYVAVDHGSAAHTFRDAVDLAIHDNASTDYVYLVEGDFLHVPGSRALLHEALAAFMQTYITLHDHPNKYAAYPRGGEETRVLCTPHHHWKVTRSTGLTFATTAGRLQLDRKKLQWFTDTCVSNSYGLFRYLNSVGVRVFSALPGLATPCRAGEMSPFTDWNKV